MACRWLLLAVIIGGCSTPYQSIGFSGGVDGQQLTADTYRIVARGNAYTSQTAIQVYALLKAAETTRQAGATHFIILDGADASSSSYITTPGNARTTVSGDRAYTTFDPGSIDKLVKPGQDTIIRILSVGTGQRPPPGALSADEIIQFVGARVRRG